MPPPRLRRIFATTCFIGGTLIACSSETATNDSKNDSPSETTKCGAKPNSLAFPDQDCVEAHCCAEVKTCFNLATGGSDCSDYGVCYTACSSSDRVGNEISDCLARCDEKASGAVQDAYNEIVVCHSANCGAGQ